ncbi:hypothetical protein NP493_692g02006 [Ridgeia piscesae]|uniref:Calx-beta domain-containing protein n=1 Tax=Ridgeia piscesae TaxID=27915 RepID=A0AAD9KRD2_RIDPI|nr:hypothetical protein NP493_692g02006 [Ridgeia piscesae]
MGYAKITIRRNDFWNGQIGFYYKNSSHVTADEDKGRPAILTLERRNASYGTLTVFWKAKIQRGSDEVVSEQLDLTTQLERVTDDVHCAAGQHFCTFSVPLFDDAVPENETSFVVELTQVSPGAVVDPTHRFATVTLLRSDHPSGMVQFKAVSRCVYPHSTLRLPHFTT